MILVYVFMLCCYFVDGTGLSLFQRGTGGDHRTPRSSQRVCMPSQWSWASLVSLTSSPPTRASVRFRSHWAEPWRTSLNSWSSSSWSSWRSCLGCLTCTHITWGPNIIPPSPREWHTHTHKHVLLYSETLTSLIWLVEHFKFAVIMLQNSYLN